MTDHTKALADALERMVENFRHGDMNDGEAAALRNAQEHLSAYRAAPSLTVGERERFEAWAGQEGFDWATGAGMWAWKAWQARAALAPAAQAEPVAWKWRNKKTEAVGAYFEDPRNFGISMDHPDYEWSRLYGDAPSNPPAQVKDAANELEKGAT